MQSTQPSPIPIDRSNPTPEPLAPPAPIVSLLPPACLFLAVGLSFVTPSLGPWPLALVALGLILSVGLLHQRWPWTVFDPPLLLFLASAGLGAVIAQTQGLAWVKFWEILSAIVMFRAVLLIPAQVRLGRTGVFSPWRWFFGLLPALIALFFVLTNDWQQWSGKMAWLDAAGRLLSPWRLALPDFTGATPRSGSWALHPNAAGGMIAVLIPLQLAALLTSRSRRVRGVLAVLVLASFAGLALTGSRGAWLALAAGLGGWAAWEMSQRWPRRLGRAQRRAVWLVLILAAAVVALLAGAAVCGATCQAAAAGRLELSHNALDLALETPFTGLGLGGERFELAYSSYILLLHVGYLWHSHNMILQLLLEQGILGLAALAWLAIAVLTRRGPFSLWQVAAFASLAVLLLHGLVDIPLFAGRGLRLLFVPLAVLVSPAAAAVPLLESGQPRTGRLRELLAPFILLVALASLLLPATRALLQVNLGALAQQRAELSVYTWPAWPIQDELRRSPEVDLDEAMARYQAALVLNPRNAAANRRLGQIELSRGQYDAARDHLEAAYAAAPGNRATRQLLAESYAIAGDTARAAALLRTVDLSNGQLDARVFWYNHIGEPERARFLRQAQQEITR